MVRGNRTLRKFLQAGYRIVNRTLGWLFGLRVIRAKPRVHYHLYPNRTRPLIAENLNIGAGRWYHPLWHNLDHPFEGYDKSQGTVDFVHDLTAGDPLPIESGQLSAIYTSHTIEHLNDYCTGVLFNECFRCLEPGGYLRITCPDAALAHAAYCRNDKLFWYPHDADLSIEQLLLSSFATSQSGLMPDTTVKKVSDEEIRQIFDTLPLDEAFNTFCDRVTLEQIRRYPQSHDTWFTHEKVIQMLKAAGFSNVWASSYGQSYCPKMRDLGYFDQTRPDLSLYVECRR